MKTEKMGVGKAALIEKMKKNKYVVLVILVGLLLILWPGKEKTDGNAEKVPQDPEIEFTVQNQEKKLEEILSYIDGAGKVKVLLSVQGSTERIIAYDTQQLQNSYAGEDDLEDETEESKTAVILKNDSNESAVTLKYIFPEYSGAVIAAQGADKAGVKLALTDAVASATGLSTDKITITKMKEP